MKKVADAIAKLMDERQSKRKSREELLESPEKEARSEEHAALEDALCPHCGKSIDEKAPAV